VFFTILVSCEKQAENRISSNEAAKVEKTEQAMIRSIDVNIGKERVGIQLNGKKARLTINPYSKERERFEISYSEGLNLIERFYNIKNVESHRGKPSDNLYESTQYIVNIFDEMPTRYSEDWVYYVYPKDKSGSDHDFRSWLDAMQSAKKHAEQGPLNR